MVESLKPLQDVLVATANERDDLLRIEESVAGNVLKDREIARSEVQARRVGRALETGLTRHRLILARMGEPTVKPIFDHRSGYGVFFPAATDEPMAAGVGGLNRRQRDAAEWLKRDAPVQALDENLMAGQVGKVFCRERVAKLLRQDGGIGVSNPEGDDGPYIAKHSSTKLRA